MIPEIVCLGIGMEAILFFMFFHSCMDMRYSICKTVVIFFGATVLNIIKSLLIFDMYTLKFFATLIYNFALACLLFEGRVVHTLAIHIFFVLCVFLAELTAMLIAKYIYGCNVSAPVEYNVPTLLWQITTYIMIIVYTYFGLGLIKKRKIDVNSRCVQYTLIYASIQAIILMIFYLVHVEHGVTSFVITGVSWIIVGFSVLVAALIYKMVNYAAYAKAEAEFLRKESEMKNEHFEKLKNQYMSYRRLRHDVYNHLRIIDEMDDTEKIRAYISDIKREFDVIESEENTLNKCGED